MLVVAVPEGTSPSGTRLCDSVIKIQQATTRGPSALSAPFSAPLDNRFSSEEALILALPESSLGSGTLDLSSLRRVCSLGSVSTRGVRTVVFSVRELGSPSALLSLFRYEFLIHQLRAYRVSPVRQPGREREGMMEWKGERGETKEMRGEESVDKREEEGIKEKKSLSVARYTSYHGARDSVAHSGTENTSKGSQWRQLAMKLAGTGEAKRTSSAELQAECECE